MPRSVDVQETIYDADERLWEITIRVGPLFRGNRDEPPDQEIEVIDAHCEELGVELGVGDLEAMLIGYGVDKRQLETLVAEAPGNIDPWE